MSEPGDNSSPEAPSTSEDMREPGGNSSLEALSISEGKNQDSSLLAPTPPKRGRDEEDKSAARKRICVAGPSEEVNCEEMLLTNLHQLYPRGLSNLQTAQEESVVQSHASPGTNLAYQSLRIACATLLHYMTQGSISAKNLTTVIDMLLFFLTSPLSLKYAQTERAGNALKLLLAVLFFIQDRQGEETRNLERLPVKFDGLPLNVKLQVEEAVAIVATMDELLQESVKAACSCGPLNPCQFMFYLHLTHLMKSLDAWDNDPMWLRLVPCALFSVLWTTFSRRGQLPTAEDISSIFHTQFMNNHERKDFSVRTRTFCCGLFSERESVHLARVVCVYCAIASGRACFSQSRSY